MAFKFEKLIVWQKSLNLSFVVHELASGFPKSEWYQLGAQIKRAADSVCLNIAEGSTGQTNAEFKRFLNIALRSVVEVVACLYIGKKRSMICEFSFKDIYCRCEEIMAMLNGLKKSLS